MRSNGGRPRAASIRTPLSGNDRRMLYWFGAPPLRSARSQSNSRRFNNARPLCSMCRRDSNRHFPNSVSLRSPRATCSSIIETTLRDSLSRQPLGGQGLRMRSAIFPVYWLRMPFAPVSSRRPSAKGWRHNRQKPLPSPRAAFRIRQSVRCELAWLPLFRLPAFRQYGRSNPGSAHPRAECP